MYNNNNNNQKVILVGNGGVGKSKLVYKLGGNGLYTPNKYISTIGVIVSDITTSNGTNVTIWDTAGVPKFGGLRDGYYINSNRAIIMGGSVSPQLGNESIASYRESIINVCGNIPIYTIPDPNDVDIDNVISFLQGDLDDGDAWW